MKTQLKQWAPDYIGLPFVAKGRERSGVDCYGLARLIYQEQLGVELPLYLDSYASAEGEDMQRIADEILANRGLFPAIEAGEEQPFDLISLRMCGLPMHIATVVNPGLMIHVVEGATAAIENYRSLAWKNRVLGFGRHAA